MEIGRGGLLPANHMTYAYRTVISSLLPGSANPRLPQFELPQAERGIAPPSPLIRVVKACVGSPRWEVPPLRVALRVCDWSASCLGVRPSRRRAAGRGGAPGSCPSRQLAGTSEPALVD